MRSVRATLYFNDPEFEGSVVDDANPVNSRTRFEPHDVVIRDLRGAESAMTLERNGFTVVRSPTACRDLTNDEAILSILYPEAVALVKALTGAPHAAAYGHVVRNRRPDAPRNARGPALNAHVDNDFATSRQTAARLAPAEAREACVNGRFILMNLWRPILPVLRNPLAVVDASTVQRRNLHLVKLLSSRSGAQDPHGYNLSYSAEQRWYYLSNMRPDEVLLFKQCDARPDAVQWAAHTSFDDPTTPADAAERQSIEIRTFAYLPW